MVDRSHSSRQRRLLAPKADPLWLVLAMVAVATLVAGGWVGCVARSSDSADDAIQEILFDDLVDEARSRAVPISVIRLLASPYEGAAPLIARALGREPGSGCSRSARSRPAPESAADR